MGLAISVELPGGDDVLRDDLLQTIGVNRLDVEQFFGKRLHRVALALDDFPGGLVSAHDERANLVVDLAGGFLAEPGSAVVVVE